jgi:hypothetical protein
MGNPSTDVNIEVPEQMQRVFNTSSGIWEPLLMSFYEELFPSLRGRNTIDYTPWGGGEEGGGDGGGNMEIEESREMNVSRPLNQENEPFHPDKRGVADGRSSGTGVTTDGFGVTGGNYSDSPGTTMGGKFSGSDGAGTDGWTPGPMGLLGDLSRLIAQPGEEFDEMGRMIKGLDTGTADWDRAREISGQKVTGEGLTDDPAYAAALDAYEKAVNPGLETGASLLGLDRSTVMDTADATARSQFVLPMIQDFMGREERGIDREMNAALGLGDRQYGSQMDKIGQLFGLGSYKRDLTQQGYDAQRDDYLRRGAFFENLLNVPFQMAGNTFGTSSSQSKF